MTRLRELWIDGFGCLRSTAEPFRFDRERISLFVDSNEAGKTTLQMALIASLYGVEDDERRRLSLRPRKAHWKPLDGGAFGTKLRLHDGRRNLEVSWDFAKGNAPRVIDLDANKVVTEELCGGSDPAELGQRLLGLSIEELTKTFLVHQDDLHRVVRDAEGLDALVQRAADTRGGSHNVASALEAIQNLLRAYPGTALKGPGRLETEIARLQDAVAELEKQLAALDATYAAIAERDAEYQGLVAKREALRQEAATLDYLAHVAELDELKHQLDEEQKRRAALAALEAERAKLADLRAFPAERAAELTECQTTRADRLRAAEQTQRGIESLRATALEPARAKLHQLGTLATVTQEHLDATQQLLGKTRDFEARERKLDDELSRQEAELASEGAAVEDLDLLEDRFADLGPEDGEFLLEHDRVAARAASEIEEARRMALEATMRADRILAERRRQHEAGRRTVTTGAAVAAATVVLAALLLFLHPVPAIAAALLGLSAAGWLVQRGRTTAAAAEALDAPALAEAQRAQADAEARGGALAAERDRRLARLAALARELGYEQPETLVEDYASLHDLRRLCGTLILLRTQRDQLAAQREDLEAEVATTFRLWGLEPPAGQSLTRALAGLQERMAASLRLRAQIDSLSHKIAEETEREAALRREADDAVARMRAVFDAAGIPATASLEDALALFDRCASLHRRLRQLDEELIPQATALLTEPKAVEAWRADAERLQRLVSNMREERPALLSLQARERSAEYRRQAKQAAENEEALRLKADEIGREILATINRVHAERPKLEDDLATRREALARARRHAAALGLAAQALGQIGHQVHGQWAEELNRSASAILQRLVPSLSDLKFDSRLSFGVRHRALPEPIRSTAQGPILSAGTWDQLCLAVRLCIADFVARRTDHGGLLLLDDPFAHFDDRRFEAAMRALADLARGRQQVIIFSCQRQRFNWLRERDKRWYDTHIAFRSLTRPTPPSGA